MAGLGFAALAFAGTAILAAPEANAITYGEPDCADLSQNIDCQHPNTVSLSGFREPASGEGTDSLVSFLRCSGSLLTKNPDRFVILTAGHCASAYLSGLQDGSLVDVGVSFDATRMRAGIVAEENAARFSRLRNQLTTVSAPLADTPRKDR